MRTVMFYVGFMYDFNERSLRIRVVLHDLIRTTRVSNSR